MLSSSFSSFFISSQMLDKRYVYPQEFPGVQYRTANYWQFFRLDLETLSRSLHQTTEKTPCVLNSANHMTNRWHFEITVTQAEDLERNCIRNICFVTRSTHTTDVFDMFSGAWGSFNLMKKNSWTILVPVSLPLKTSKGIRIDISPNRDLLSHSQWNYLLNHSVRPGC